MQSKTAVEFDPLHEGGCNEPCFQAMPKKAEPTNGQAVEKVAMRVILDVARCPRAFA